MKRYAAKRTVECWVNERLPRSVLSADTKLSGTLLGPVLHDLVSRGVVLRQNATQPGIRGPKPRYALKQEFGRALAIGFGHDGCGVAVTDLSASAILDGADRFSEPATRGWVDRDPTRAVAIATDLARAALEATQTAKDRLVGIGISMPAPLLPDGRGGDKGRTHSWLTALARLG
jgi:hypothetical protein